MSDIHLCVETAIPNDVLEETRLHAIQVNPANAPQFDPDDPLEGAANTRWLWPNGAEITVTFLEGDPAVQKRIEPIAHEWSQYANLTLKFVKERRADIRISFDPKGGSWSYHGVQSNSFWLFNRPSMNYGWLKADTEEQEYRRVVLHEFGHALGLIHEHLSPNATIPWDLPKLFAYYKRTNGWSEEQTRTQVINRIQVNRATHFDNNSIMLYHFPAELTTDGSSTPWNTELSELDKTFIAQLYPKPTS
ncbi:MAG: hypothetical protein KDE47_02525 [Caldilineaceae bacterium]|nr:hypothetical protein [Caldilineaceae bacterium]